MGRQIVFIWGGAILLYLLVSHASGSSSVIKSLQNFGSGVTKTLQARD